MLKKLEDLQNLRSPEEIIGDYFEIGPPTKRGWVELCCPFHEDNSPSAAISLSNGRFICPACDLNISWKELLKKARVSNPPEKEPVTYYEYRSASKKIQYVVVRYFPKTFRPFTVDGNGKLHAGLSPEKRILYNLDRIIRSGSSTVYLVEGEKDCDTLSKSGVIATTNPGGAGGWESRFAKLLKNKRVIVIPDNDEPGQTWLASVCRSLEPFKILALPDSAKDITQYLSHGGILESLPTIEPEKAPKDDDPNAIISATGVISEKRKFPPKIDTGIPIIDRYGAFREKGILVVGARPSMGKTSMCAQIAAHISEKRKVLVLPLEEDPDQFTRRILLQRHALDNIDADVDSEEVIKTEKNFDNIFFFKELVSHNIFNIKEKLEHVLEKEKIEVVFLDHLQEVWVGGQGSKHDKISTIMTILVELQKKYEFAFVLAAQLRRPPPREDIKMPELDDLRESGTIEAIAQSCVMLHYPRYYDANKQDRSIMLGLKKNRYGKRNLTGTMEWNEERMRFDNIEFNF